MRIVSSPALHTPALPGPIRQVVNVVKAVAQEVQAVAAGEPSISSADYEARIKICAGCEFFSPNIKSLPVKKRQRKQCMRCGCHMEVKAHMRSQVCPIGKW